MEQATCQRSRGHYRAGIQENYDAGREFHSRGAGIFLKPWSLELAALAEAMKGCDDAARCAEALDKATNAVRKAAKLLVPTP